MLRLVDLVAEGVLASRQPGADRGVRVLSDLLVGLLGGTRGELLGRLGDVVDGRRGGVDSGLMGDEAREWSAKGSEGRDGKM